MVTEQELVQAGFFVLLLTTCCDVGPRLKVSHVLTLLTVRKLRPVLRCAMVVWDPGLPGRRRDPHHSRQEVHQAAV